MKNVAFFVSILCADFCFSQGRISDTIHLKEANIEAAKVTVVYDEKNVFQAENDNKGITETLKKQESFFIKNYGQGGLASIAYRGTSAAQNEVYWNGIKINSPFTGQVDGNLLLLDISQNISLTSFSNAIGARIYMQEDVPKKGVSGAVLVRYTSLNSADVNAAVQYGGKHFYSVANASFVYAKNDYKMLDKSAVNNKQTHNQFLSGNASATLGYTFNDMHDLSVSFWYSHNNREIPPLITQATSQQTQYDRSVRALLNYKLNARKMAFIFRAAYLNDVLNYQDLAIGLYSRNRSSVLRSDISLCDFVSDKIGFEVAAKYDFEYAFTDSFQTSKQRSIAEIREHFSYTLQSFNFHLTAFQTIYKTQVIPSFQLASRYNFRKFHTQNNVGISASRTLRIPSMNDLYWSVGGNPNLKPETGWKGEAYWQLSYRYIGLKTTVYGQYTANYILWSPVSPVIWKSENLKRVYGCGTEVFVSAGLFENMKKKWFLYFVSSYSWNRTINMDAISANDESANKQLIYVPVHKAYAAVRGGWRGFSASVDYTYFSKIYITTDNSQSLYGYGLMDLHLSYSFTVKGQKITPSFGIYNVLNTEYQTMKNRAMPGRYYEVLVRLNLKG